MMTMESPRSHKEAQETVRREIPEKHQQQHQFAENVVTTLTKKESEANEVLQEEEDCVKCP